VDIKLCDTNAGHTSQSHIVTTILCNAGTLGLCI